MKEEKVNGLGSSPDQWHGVGFDSIGLYGINSISKQQLTDLSVLTRVRQQIPIPNCSGQAGFPNFRDRDGIPILSPSTLTHS